MLLGECVETRDMPATFPAILALFLAIILPAAFVISTEFPASLTLERAFPRNHRVDISKLWARDMARHGRILKSSDDHIIDFPVQGTYDPYLVGYIFPSFSFSLYMHIHCWFVCSCTVVHAVILYFGFFIMVFMF